MPNNYQIPNTIPVVGTIAPAASSDTYPVTNPAWGLGGFRTVELSAERNAIPEERREVGMAVYVNTLSSYYVLSGGITNDDWVPWPRISEETYNTYITNINNTFPLDLEKVDYVHTGSKTSHYPLSGAYLNAINNGSTTYGPWNVLKDVDGNLYVPLDISRGDTLMVTLSSPLVSDLPNQQPGELHGVAKYKGFILVNNTDVVSAGDTFIVNDVDVPTFIEMEERVNHMYTLTVFLKHLNIVSDIPVDLYKGTITIDALGKATELTTELIPTNWSGGEPPAIYATASSPTFVLGSEDIWMYSTKDGGAEWYGFLGGLSFFRTV